MEDKEVYPSKKVWIDMPSGFDKTGKDLAQKLRQMLEHGKKITIPDEWRKEGMDSHDLCNDVYFGDEKMED